MITLAQATERNHPLSFLPFERHPCAQTAATFASVITDRIVLKECYGVIPEIVSDRDTLLTSKFWDALSARLGTKMSMSTSRTQWTNGTAERMIAVVEEMLRTRIHWSQTNWYELLTHIEFAINIMPQPSLQGHSAIYFERGVEPTLPIDLFRSVHGDNARDAQSNDPSQKVLASDRIALLVDIRTQCIAGLQNTASRLDKQ